MTDPVFYPTFKDEDGNHFILEAERFMWPSAEIADRMGQMVDPKMLGTDVEYSGVEKFDTTEDGAVCMHHIDAYLRRSGRLIRVSIIGGPILKERCNCVLH